MGAVVGAITAVLLSAAAAQAQGTATAPPKAGGWRISAYSQGVPVGEKPIDEFTGSFKVTMGSSAATGLKGTSGRQVNNGCNPGVSVKMLGRAPIKHFVASNGTDFYWIGTGTELWYTLKFTFTAKHSHKAHKGKGKLRLYFPGGANIFVSPNGQGGFGSLEFNNATIGFCNLYFDVK